MPAIYRNGTRYGNAPTSYPASNVAYDPTTSGLSATNAQNAIDELRGLDPQIKTASGSIASFTDGGDDIPVSEYECEIVAQQASGTPTPSSPLSITGFSQADISVCGLNIFDEEMEVGTLDNSTGATETDANKMRSVNFIPVKPNTTYGVYNNTGVNLYIYSYGSDKSFIGFDNTGMVTGSTFTTDSNTHYIKFRTQNNPTYSNNISINYPSSDTQYHAYTGNTYLVEFGQTIYGGRLIYKDGQWAIEATHEIVDLGDLSWASLSRDRWNTTDLIGSIKVPLTNRRVANIICSALASKSADDVYLQNEGISVQTTGDTTIYSTTLVGKTSAEVQTALSSVQFVYELATPVIIPLASSARIKTLPGINNIFSNTGDNSVKYFTNGSDTIVELVEQVSYTKEQTDEAINNSVTVDTYSGLQTTDKKIIGAINEVNAKASKLDNMTATASGSIATFSDGGDDIPVSEYECEIVAQQASGTPTPASPLPITGFSQADILVYKENLFVSTNKLTKDGITSFSQSTGLISIKNDSRTTNFISGSQRTLIVSGLDTSHTYKYVFYPNVTGIILADLNTAPLNNTFTGIESCDLRITNQYDFVNDHPIGDITTVRLFIFDMTVGYDTTYTVAFGQSIYGGRLIYDNGEWSIEATHVYVELNGTENLTEFETNRWRYNTGIALESSFANQDKEKCSHFAVANTSSWSGLLQGCFMVAGGSYIGVGYTGDFNAYALAQYNNGTPIQFSLLLTNPVIIPITSATRVKTISGVNNIFSNTGDNSVKYFTENADEIAELIKAFVL